MSERMPGRRPSKAANHLAAAHGTTPIRPHTYSTVGAAGSALEKREDHFGGAASGQACAFGRAGRHHASSARSGALEDMGWTAARKDDAGYFGKLATAAASLS